MSSKVVDSVHTWTVKLPWAHERLVDEGQQVEMICPTGLVIFQRDPEGFLHVTWIAQSETGFGQRR